MKKDQQTWKFEELGKKLDQLAERMRGRTQEEAEKAGAEIKEWGRDLTNLGIRSRRPLRKESKGFLSKQRRESRLQS